MTGTHIIIDINNIKDNEKLKYSLSIFPILNKIVNEFNLKVVAQAFHQFEPYGFTAVYVLSESHLSIHTFVEEGKVALDLYTCSIFNNEKELYELLKNEFGDECLIYMDIIKRK